MMHEDNIRALEEALDEVITSNGLDLDSEIRGSDLFSGRNAFKGLRPPKRISIAEQCIEAIVEHASAFGIVGLNKSASYAADHPHRICFGLMIEGIEPFLRRHEATGLIIADEYDETKETLVQDMRHFKRDGTRWGYKKIVAKRIVDCVHYVKSSDSRAIQAVDLITFIRSRAFLTRRTYQKEGRENGLKGRNLKTWISENMTRAEKATDELDQAIDLTVFRDKVWPPY